MQSCRFFRRNLFNAPVLKTDLFVENNAAQKPINEIPIVIVGAGLAGLSAANHLIKHGFKRTVVLEATDRYGGRVSSKKFGDTFCELGAKWVAVDASQDSMYDLLRQSTGLPKKLRHRHENTFYINPHGIRVNWKMAAVVEMLFQRLFSNIQLDDLYKAGKLHDLNSVHTFFQAEIAKSLNMWFAEHERPLARDIFSTLVKEFGSWLGCCLEYVNIEHITHTKIDKPSPMYIPTGLDNVFSHMVTNLENGQMQMGKPVGEIRWLTPSKYDQKAVGCIDGSVFYADHIICTLPLGVLKNFAPYMFKPQLPKEKLKAIKNLGYGSPVKIYFEYNRNVKPWFSKNIRPIWSVEDLREERKWSSQIIEIATIPKSDKVLEIRVGGGFYDEIEKLPDVEVVDEVTKLLRSILRTGKIPYPTSMLRSDWSSCACYLGGRPYFATNSNHVDVKKLAAPLGEEPSLLFAGDATILRGFGTLDGARMSGIREAQRIVEYYHRLL